MASWNSTPPKPLPTTTGMRPAGAGRAPEHRDRPARRLLGDRRRVAVEQLEAGMTGERLAARLDPVVAARHHLRPEPHARAIVPGEQPVGVGHLHPPPAFDVGRRDLADLVADAACALVAFAQQLGLPLRRHRLRIDAHLLERRRLRGRERPRLGPLRPHRGGDLVGEPLEVGLREPVDVPEVGCVAGHHANRRARLRPGLGALDAAVVERQREAVAALDVEVGEVPSAAQRARDQAARRRPPRAAARGSAGMLALPRRLQRRRLADQLSRQGQQPLAPPACRRRATAPRRDRRRIRTRGRRTSLRRRSAAATSSA